MAGHDWSEQLWIGRLFSSSGHQRQQYFRIHEAFARINTLLMSAAASRVREEGMRVDGGAPNTNNIGKCGLECFSELFGPSVSKYTVAKINLSMVNLLR